jgi:hypothetical protein
MEDKISREAVDRYSEAYAKKVSDSFFARNERITGSGILSLCPVQQVNLFAIAELFRIWSLETEKLKSPYFDYQSPEVKEALEVFQNVLSRNISITRHEFFPILKKAVTQTVLVILNPYDFYSRLLDQSHLKVSDLKDHVRYLKINKAPLQSLLEKLEAKQVEVISGTEAFGILDHILEEVNFTPEEIDPYLEALNQTQPVSMEQLYEPRPKPPEPKPAAPSPAPAKSKTSVADNFQKISSLKESLTINQKFMFTKMLFEGDFDRFAKAIDELDKLTQLEEAMSFLRHHYPSWDVESEEYEEFVMLVEKRFA